MDPTRNDASETIGGLWGAEEDLMLTRLVEKHGPKWTVISRAIIGRSANACMLRWLNQLSPTVDHCPFSVAELETIMAAHSIYDNKWSTIAKLLPGRTGNAVKNQWYVGLKRQTRGEGSSGGANIQNFDLNISCNGEEEELEENELTALTLAASGLVVGAAEKREKSAPPTE